MKKSWIWNVDRPAMVSFRRKDYHGDEKISLDKAVRDTICIKFFCNTTMAMPVTGQKGESSAKLLAGRRDNMMLRPTKIATRTICKKAMPTDAFDGEFGLLAFAKAWLS